MDNRDEIIKRLEALEGKKKDYFVLFEKLLLPLVLGLLTFFVGNGAQQISKAQLELAKSQERTALNLKYLELFYKDINDPKKPEAQQSALSLLHVIEPEIGNKLARAVEYNKANSKEIREIAANMGPEMAIFGPLVNYKVILYYLKGDTYSSGWASFYEGQLNNRGFKNVKKQEVTHKFYIKMVSPKGFEIRHDDYYEKEAASRLSALLTSMDKRIVFNKIPTQLGRTPFALTVFLPPELPAVSK